MLVDTREGAREQRPQVGGRAPKCCLLGRCLRGPGGKRTWSRRSVSRILQRSILRTSGAKRCKHIAAVVAPIGRHGGSADDRYTKHNGGKGKSRDNPPARKRTKLLTADNLRKQVQAPERAPAVPRVSSPRPHTPSRGDPRMQWGCTSQGKWPGVQPPRAVKLRVPVRPGEDVGARRSEPFS